MSTPTCSAAALTGDYGNKDRVDVIVTNPPFGGTEEDAVENQFPATYRNFDTL